MKQNGNSFLAKINQNQSHETGGTIFNLSSLRASSRRIIVLSVGQNGQPGTDGPWELPWLIIHGVENRSCPEKISDNWTPLLNGRKLMSSLNLLQPNFWRILVKNGFFSTKTMPDVRDNELLWFDSIVHVQAAIHTQVIR